MLDTSADNMLQEFQAGEADRDQHLPYYERMISAYHGEGFKSITTSERMLANHFFEYITLINPRIIQDNPKLLVSTDSTDENDRLVSKALKHAGQKWIVNTKLVDHLVRAAMDFSFAWCVAYVEHRKGKKDEYEYRNPKAPGWPVVERVPVRRFFMDPGTLCFDEARWMGHLIVRDKEDLLKEAKEHPERGWNASAIEALGDDIGIDRLKERRSHDIPTRKEVVLFQFWVRDAQPDPDLGIDDGFFGGLYTIAIDRPLDGKQEDERGVSVRDPIPFWGPPEGPYVMGGAYMGSTDDPWPLSPLAAVYSQVEEFNDQVTAAANASRRYKRIVFVDDADIQTAEAVIGSPDGYVVPIPGLKDATGGRNIIEVEIGGVSESQIQMIQLWQMVLERTSGIDSAQRGEVEGRGTATEVAVADKVTDTRISRLKIEFQKYTIGVLTRALWYIYHDDEIEIPLSPEAAQEIGLDMQNPVFKGGDPDPSSKASFWNLDLSIETMSMERTTEALNSRRILQATNLIASMAPVIRQFPEVDWKSILSRMGDSLNIPDFDEVVDYEMASQLLGVEMAASSKPDAPQASYSGDSGGSAAPTPALQSDPAIQPFQSVMAESAGSLGQGSRL